MTRGVFKAYVFFFHISVYSSQMTDPVPKRSYHAQNKWEHIKYITYKIPLLEFFYDRECISGL